MNAINHSQHIKDYLWNKPSPSLLFSQIERFMLESGVTQNFKIGDMELDDLHCFAPFLSSLPLSLSFFMIIRMRSCFPLCGTGCGRPGNDSVRGGRAYLDFYLVLCGVGYRWIYSWQN